MKELRSKATPIFISILIVFLLLGGWDALEEGGVSGADPSGASYAARSALAEIALKEYKENGNVEGSGEKYWSYWGREMEQWCVDFLYYCGDRLGLVGAGKPFGVYTAGVGEAWDNIVAAGARVYAVGEDTPQPGDIVFWYGAVKPPRDISGVRPSMKHIGIVISYTEEEGLVTVEGNSGGLGSARNYVAKNTYADITGLCWSGTAIYGFARISASGVGDLTQMIKSFEGFSPYPVWDYGQYSVGYGTACPADKYERYALYGITEEEAIDLLNQNIDLATDTVEKYIASADLRLLNYQRDALISLSYNIGGNWIVSPDYENLRRVIEDRELDELTVMQVFAQISHAGGKLLPALVQRRMCEAHLFCTGEYLTNFADTGYTYEIVGDTVRISRRTVEGGQT